MNNEVTIRNDAPVSLVEIRCDRLRFPRLVAVEREEAVSAIQQIISEAMLIRGQKGAEETVAFTAETLYQELLRDADGAGLKYITLEEIRREVRAAALGRRGDLYGINVASLYGVLWNYALGEGHRAEETARQRKKAALKKAFQESPVGAALTAAAGKIAKNNKI